jgi:predicted Zn finger-like uncharacterized protein
MPITVECPSCATRLKVADQHAGRRVKCPKCGTVMSVPALGGGPRPAAAATPRPARPARQPAPPPVEELPEEPEPSGPAPKKSRKGLWIGLGIGCSALLLLCCGGTALVGFFMMPETNPKVTPENFAQLKEGMTLTQVEAILGPGKEATLMDVNLAYATQPPDKLKAAQDDYGKAIGKGAVYRWKNGPATIFVVFNGPPKSGGKAQVLAYSASVMGASMVQQVGFFPK